MGLRILYMNGHTSKARDNVAKLNVTSARVNIYNIYVCMCWYMGHLCAVELYMLRECSVWQRSARV